MGSERAKAVILICAILAVQMGRQASSTGVDIMGEQWMWERSECSSGGGECVIGGVDLEMETDTDRRSLAQRMRYISYGALRRNTVPCSRRGASYYNCRPGAHANPYSRGCSSISRCRR